MKLEPMKVAFLLLLLIPLNAISQTPTERMVWETVDSSFVLSSLRDLDLRLFVFGFDNVTINENNWPIADVEMNVENNYVEIMGRIKRVDPDNIEQLQLLLEYNRVFPVSRMSLYGYAQMGVRIYFEGGITEHHFKFLVRNLLREREILNDNL